MLWGVVNPSFESVILAVVGVLATWFVLFFPFAIACMVICRDDAFNGIESYVLGQTAGPVGVWLVVRANRKAVRLEYERNLTLDYKRAAPEQLPTATPEEIQLQIKAEGLPRVEDMPGGRAFRPPAEPGRKPPATTVEMDKVSLPKDVAEPADGAPADD